MLLTDPLDADAIALLRIVRSGYRGPRGFDGEQWPTWQWVRWKADRQGLDAEGLRRALPTWQHSYRPIRGEGLGGPMQLDKPVELTVHGLVAAGDDDLVPVFLAALAVAAEYGGDVEPNPYALDPVVAAGDALTAAAERRSGRRPLQPSVVRALLLREPPTWMGHSDPQTWQWDLTFADLRRFIGVKRVEDYLERLEDVVGVRPPAAAAVPMSPLALLDALDHLNAEWRLRTTQRLLQSPRLALPAQLGQPVSSGSDFQAACSALDDLLKQLRPRPEPAVKDEGTLNQLDRRLSQLLDGDAAARAKGAVVVLRQVNALRVGQQHTGTGPYQKQQQARRALGLSDPVGDWSGDWHRLQHAVLDALRVMRDELASGDTS